MVARQRGTGSSDTPRPGRGASGAGGVEGVASVVLSRMLGPLCCPREARRGNFTVLALVLIFVAVVSWGVLSTMTLLGFTAGGVPLGIVSGGLGGALFEDSAPRPPTEHYHRFKLPPFGPRDPREPTFLPGAAIPWHLADEGAVAHQGSTLAALYPPPLRRALQGRMRIFVYDMPPQFTSEPLANLARGPGAAKRRRMYSDQRTEVALHEFLLRSAARTRDPEKADLYFVPVYAAAMVSGRITSAAARDAARTNVLAAVRSVRSRFPWWDRHGGADHVLVASHDHGMCLDVVPERATDGRTYSQLRAMLSRATLLTPEGEVGNGCFDPIKDVTIPPFTAPEHAQRAKRRLNAIATAWREMYSRKVRQRAGPRTDAATPPSRALHPAVRGAEARGVEDSSGVGADGGAQGSGEEGVEAPPSPDDREGMRRLLDRHERLVDAWEREKEGSGSSKAQGSSGAAGSEAQRPTRGPDPGEDAEESPLAGLPLQSDSFSALYNAKRDTFAVFRGRASGERADNPPFGVNMLFGRPEEQTRLPVVHMPTREAAGCEEELSRRRVYSRGVRMRIRHAFAHSTRIRVLDGVSPDYIGEMERSVFCIAPLGYATWSIRTFEALAAGCIPVVVADNTLLPFEAFLDWSKVVVRVREADYSRLEQVLAAIPRERVVEMQAHGALAHHLLLYPEHPAPGGRAVELSAFGMILRSLRGRLYGDARVWDTLWQERLAAGRPAPALPAQLSLRWYPLHAGPGQGPAARVTHPRGAPLICAAIAAPLSLWPSLLRFTRAWPGFVSAALYVRDLRGAETAIADAVRGASSLVVTLVESPPVAGAGATDPSPAPTDPGTAHAWPFPGNALRNRAVSSCPRAARYVMSLHDAAILPAADAYAQLQRQASTTDSPAPTVLVVPTVRATGQGADAGAQAASRSSSELQRALADGGAGVAPPATPFLAEHGGTRHGRLGRAKQLYTVPYTFGYAPTLLFHRPSLPWPLYDEMLHGGYPAHAAAAYELDARGYSFVVTPQSFLLSVGALADRELRRLSAGDDADPRIACALGVDGCTARGDEGGAAALASRGVDVVGWSCWRNFTDRVEAEWGARPSEPCWVSQQVWPPVNRATGSRCMLASDTVVKASLRPDPRSQSILPGLPAEEHGVTRR